MINSQNVTGQPCSVCYADSLNELINNVSYCQKCANFAFPSRVTATKRGGVRVGSGRPRGGGRWGAYDGKLTRVWVPSPVASQLPEFVQSVRELLESFDALTIDHPDSPRKKIARQLVQELNEICKLIE